MLGIMQEPVILLFCELSYTQKVLMALDPKKAISIAEII
jgi:hypothetical protein